MNAQHTAGPWRVGKNLSGEPIIRRPDNCVVAMLDCGGFGREKLPKAESEANACLIAAAPELLAAAIRGLNFIQNTEGELGITLDSGDLLRAAIAKARGEV